MTTSVTNTIIIIDNEGDSSSAAQTTVVSTTINRPDQTPISVNRIVADPVSVTKSDVVVAITRKTIDPIIITIPA
jgi:hypothetical protein